MKVGVGLSMDQMLYEIHTTNFFVWFGGVCIQLSILYVDKII